MPEEKELENTVVCIGDNCIDRYDFPTKRRFVGGNAINTAVHAREAGCPTSYVGSVGMDSNGRAILQTLQSRGIDTSQVQVFDAETAWTQVSLTDGERRFTEEYLGPVERFRWSEAVYRYLFSHFLIHNTWQGGTEKQLPIFREKGKSLLSMDFGERYSEEFLHNCIPYVDIGFFSMDPDSADGAIDFARRMNGLGPSIVVVTMGKRGSVVSRNQTETYFTPAKSIKPVDTLGAGDTYIGTFIAAFVQGNPIRQCMERATAAAAKNCMLFSGFAGSEILEEQDG